MSLSHPPPAVRAAGVACAMIWLLYVLGLVAGLDGALARAFDELAYDGLLLAGGLLCALRAARVETERVPWSLLAAALLTWVAADLYFATLDSPSYPSLADLGWLVFYPLSYAGLALLVRARLRVNDAGLWLDGVLGGLTLAAVGAALVFGPIVAASEGSVAAIATNLAYPIGDLLLLVFVIGAIGLSGWRPGRSMLLLGAGLVVGAVADSWYLYLVAVGEYHDRSLIDALWPLSMLLVAWAAWQPAPRSRVA